MAATDREDLSAIIGHIYDCVIEPAGWTATIEKLTHFVGGASALLFHQDRAHRSGDFIHSFNADPEWTRLYFEHYIQINPVLPFTVFMEVGDCAALSTFIAIEEFKRSQFYLEWAAPQNFLDVVVSMLDKGATSMGMFAVTRFETDGPAGEEALSRMRLVAPHIRRAVTIQRMFSQIEGRSCAFVAAVEALPDAVFFLTQDQSVAFANAAGRDMAERGGGLAIVSGRLSLRDAEAARRLAQALRNAGETTALQFQPEFTLDHADGTKFTAHLLPVSQAHRREMGQTGIIAAFFVRRAEPRLPPPMQALAERFGLTPRELQIFTGIVQFGGVPEVARIYGVSPTTVRTHLQNVFDKTGVRRQADLARIAAGLTPPPPASCDPSADQ